MNLIKKTKALIKDLVFIFLFIFIVLEVSAFILSFFNMLPFNDAPSFYKHEKVISYKEWLTEELDWGAWHKPNQIVSHNTNCFSAKYNSNEIGAKDSSIEKKFLHKSTYILLGDSFAEGYGVNNKDSSQNLIQEKTGINILNFGTSGDFGPIQYAVIYSKLASKYNHEGLIIYFLPANDFVDNDYNIWKSKSISEQKRWRPYFKKTSENNFTWFIPENAVKFSNNISRINVAENYLWLNNFYKTFKLIRLTFLNKNKKVLDSYSGYFSPTEEQQKAAVFFIDKIMSESKASKIILISIPRPQDISRVYNGADKNKMLWYQLFKTSSSRLQKKIVFIDLLDYLPKENINNIFYQCDGHWNAYGNKWAADVISSKINAQ